MKKYLFLLIIFCLFAVLVNSASLVSAHERQVFHIGDKDYLFVVGSINEPVYVDDKSGVDLRVKLADPQNPGDSSSANSKPVENLEKTLKVEVIAGTKKKLFDLTPAYKDPGAYRANFYPTVATTYAYRFIGTINDKPFNVTFTCNPAGHSAAVEENKTIVKISDTVIRTFQTGIFGCPISKADAGFPEPSADLRQLNANKYQNSLWPDILAIIISLVAIGIVWRRK